MIRAKCGAILEQHISVECYNRPIQPEDFETASLRSPAIRAKPGGGRQRHDEDLVANWDLELYIHQTDDLARRQSKRTNADLCAIMRVEITGLAQDLNCIRDRTARTSILFGQALEFRHAVLPFHRREPV